MFDPDEVARTRGEGHLVPPNVRPLTPQQRADLTAWAERVVKAREHRQQREYTVYDYATETDPLLVAAAAAGSVELVYRFIKTTPVTDGTQRLALWKSLLGAHLLVDRLQVLMLNIDLEAEQIKTMARRDRDVVGGIDL